MVDAHDRIAKRLTFLAAVLFMLANITGMYVGLAASGSAPGDPHTVLGAHVVGLLGSLWLLGGAFSLRFTSLSERALEVLSWLFVVPAYGNWLVTSIKAMLHVHGVAMNGSSANDVVFVLLMLLVVLPSLAGGSLWVWALRGR